MMPTLTKGGRARCDVNGAHDDLFSTMQLQVNRCLAMQLFFKKKNGPWDNFWCFFFLTLGPSKALADHFPKERKTRLF